MLAGLAMMLAAGCARQEAPQKSTGQRDEPKAEAPAPRDRQRTRIVRQTDGAPDAAAHAPAADSASTATADAASTATAAGDGASTAAETSATAALPRVSGPGDVPDLTALEPRAEFDAIRGEIAKLDLITRVKLEADEVERLKRLSETAENRIAQIQGADDDQVYRTRVFSQVMRQNIDAAAKTEKQADFAARVDNIQRNLTAIENLMKGKGVPR
jgi:hypothetical protein